MVQSISYYKCCKLVLVYHARYIGIKTSPRKGTPKINPRKGCRGHACIKKIKKL